MSPMPTFEEAKREAQRRNDLLALERASPEYKAKRAEQERVLAKFRRKYGLDRKPK